MNAWEYGLWQKDGGCPSDMSISNLDAAYRFCLLSLDMRVFQLQWRQKHFSQKTLWFGRVHRFRFMKDVERLVQIVTSHSRYGQVHLPFSFELLQTFEFPILYKNYMILLLTEPSLTPHASRRSFPSHRDCAQQE